MQVFQAEELWCALRLFAYKTDGSTRNLALEKRFFNPGVGCLCSKWLDFHHRKSTKAAVRVGGAEVSYEVDYLQGHLFVPPSTRHTRVPHEPSGVDWSPVSYTLGGLQLAMPI